MKIALVSGGNDGIGLAISRKLLNIGYKVIVVDKNINNICEVDSIVPLQCDITSPDNIKDSFSKIDHIDLLVHSAGVGAWGNFDKLDHNVIRKVMNINFLGSVRIIKESLLKMQQGHIVIISSTSGKIAMPGSIAYSCSKFALNAFAESLRSEVRNKGITVTVINPSNVRTVFSAHMLAGSHEPTDKGVTVDFAVKEILRAIDKRSRDAYIPHKMIASAIIDAICPSLIDRFFLKCHRSFTGGISKNQIAIVTGASSGIGKATAYSLCSNGLTVVMVARDQTRLIDAAREAARYGGYPVPVSCDLRDKDAVSQMVQKLIVDFSRIDLLINNAGFSVSGRVEEIPSDSYANVMETNFYGSINITKEVLHYMELQNQGHIVNVLSTNAIRGMANLSAYGATKFALRAFSRALDREMAISGYNIKVSEVFPATVCTPMIIEYVNHDSIKQTRMKDVVGGKGLTPQDVAGSIIRLLETGHTRAFLPKNSYFLLLGNTLAPGVIDRIFKF